MTEGSTDPTTGCLVIVRTLGLKMLFLALINMAQEGGGKCGRDLQDEFGLDVRIIGRVDVVTEYGALKGVH